MRNNYSIEETKEALQNLEQNLSDKNVENGIMFQVANGADISQDYSSKSLKRININNCSFNRSSFKSVAAVGAKFSKVVFRGCDFSSSNFQYCYFEHVDFIDNSFASGANFSHSIFIECNFNKVRVQESTFFDCQFHKCHFTSGDIKLITLENSMFCHCFLDRLNLSCLNLEYTQIVEISMNDVILPPYQIAYIIGGLSYLFATNDSVFVYTDKGHVSLEKYRKQIHDLVIYYHLQHDFFPLANIMIGLSEYESAWNYIRQGIMESFDYFDFRMVKYYCKLAISCEGFSHTQLKILYDFISDLSYQKNFDTKQLHSFFINIGEIRELLLNTAENKERVEFIIKTTIDKDDMVSINTLYNHINRILRDCCSAEHIDSIELRHNSPYELLITCIDAMPSILALIPAIYGLLLVGEKALDLYQKFEEIRRTHQENTLYKYNKKIKELEIMEKEQAITAQKKKTQLDILGIASVSEIQHSIICNTLHIADSIPPELLHFKYKKS